MPEWVSLGRRVGDCTFVVNFNKERALVRANTAWVGGVALEEIPEGVNGFSPGIVLIHRDWQDLYLVKEREDWTENDYFKFAKRRFTELSIVP